MPTQAKDIFEAQSKSVYELLSDNGVGLYLPPYQRPFGWSAEKVLKLLDDTCHGLKCLGDNADSFTFLGSVITIHDVNHVNVNPLIKPEVPAKVLTVIDGQQRISTLLLLVVSLHNLIRQKSWKVFKGKGPDATEDALKQLYSETEEILKSLALTFYEKKSTGDTPIYPRLIRAYDDQWSKSSEHKQYVSPVARLLYEYAAEVEAEQSSATRFKEFTPVVREDYGKGEKDLIARFKQISNTLKKLAKQEPVDELDGLPPLSDVASKTEFQQALFSHELGTELCNWAAELEDEPEAELMRLLMFAGYALNRIALTIVQGKDEDYAFSIFESLNTTGEPLTAFETFLPQVVMAEGIGSYLKTDSAKHMADVQLYLDQFGVGDKLQTATQDLLVTFALTESGFKLSKRLSEQRKYMTRTFHLHKDDQSSREAYILNLKDTATFLRATWDPVPGNRELVGLPTAMTDEVKLCLAFLIDLKHTITIPPLVRFYSVACNGADDQVRAAKGREFEDAVKAITAFTVLWRATRQGTGNIDGQYRALMDGGDSLTDMGPLAREKEDGVKGKPKSQPEVDVQKLKHELRSRLTGSEHGGVADRDSFVRSAVGLPIYNINKKLTRFLLLAAYHDTVAHRDDPGQIMSAKDGVVPFLTPDGWLNEESFTIEHIAPQAMAIGWDQALYEDKDSVHQLGNLVLVPQRANSSLGARSWEEKRVLYRALGANTPEEAKVILDESGLSFAETTEELAKISRHLPQLAAVGERTGEWDLAFMEARGKVLLGLAYDRLKGWLDLP
jgi:hypothetical protein